MVQNGLATPLPAPVRLTAGGLSCTFAAGEMRDVCWHGMEVVQRLYVAVRDHDWGTVPLVLDDVQIVRDREGFRVTFTATHHADTPEPIAFRWHGAFVGTADGTLTATMDGAAEITFRRNRIGWCVLHPPETCAGQPCTVTHPDGTTTDAPFPALIAPHQPFVDIRQMAYTTRDGAHTTLRFDGDIFETEDQRNWTDDSYKTYSTPLTLPMPVTLAAGDTVRQSVTVTVAGAGEASGAQSSLQPQSIAPPIASGDAGVTITVHAEAVGPLPEIGLGIAAGALPTDAETERLRALHLGHLRLDLHFAPDSGDSDRQPRVQDTWNTGAAYASALNVPLLVALFLPPLAGGEAAHALAALVAAHHAAPAPVVAWLVFDANGSTTPAPLAVLARAVLGAAFPNVPIGGGTDSNFTELNRTRPPVQALDFVSWSINPQVHAEDNLSIVETLAGQATTAESTRAFAAGLPLTVSPVTLRQRSNPHATAPAAPLPPGTPPPQMDTRQLSLLGAGWTAISVKQLAVSGIVRATYYETLGACGVMERDAGSPYPDAFPSLPGGVFPLYHVLADIGEVVRGVALPTTSDAPRHVHAFAIRHVGGVRLLVANLHDAAEHVTIHLPTRAHAATLRLLDTMNVRDAMHDPQQWRTLPPSPLPLSPDGTTVTVPLPPYAVACIDVTEAVRG